MLRSFFSYVPRDPFPEMPKVEPPDPNSDRALSDSFRSARRSLIAWCAICLAWSTAQFGIQELTIEAAGFTVDLKNASVPLLLGAGLAYLSVRWVIEFAMMPRHVRRWPLAQLDFRVVSVVARFSALAITAGALNRSLWTIAAVAIALFCLALASIILSIVLVLITMPIRMWARSRAEKPSAASAAAEAVIWAEVFAVILVFIGTGFLGVASYYYQPWREMIWPSPPNPIALSVFVITLIAIFLSHWLLRPIIGKLFAERPNYFTEQSPEGEKRVTFIRKEKEPLL